MIALWITAYAVGVVLMTFGLARWFALNSETDADKIAEAADSFRVTAHEQKGT